MTDQISKAMITDWTHHPITVEFLRIVAEFVEANKEDLTLTALGNAVNRLEVQDKLTQLKGQIFVAEAILDIKTFLSELTEEEVKNENTTGSRT